MIFRGNLYHHPRNKTTLGMAGRITYLWHHWAAEITNSHQTFPSTYLMGTNTYLYFLSYIEKSLLICKAQRILVETVSIPRQLIQSGVINKVRRTAVMYRWSTRPEASTISLAAGADGTQSSLQKEHSTQCWRLNWSIFWSTSQSSFLHKEHKVNLQILI